MELQGLRLADLIALLNEIEKNYCVYKNVWTSDKVERLRDLIIHKICLIGSD